MKRRPPPFRTPDSPSAMASIASRSSARMSAMLSSRYSLVNVLMFVSGPVPRTGDRGSGTVEVRHDACTVEIEAKPHGPKASCSESFLHASPLGRANVEHEEAAAACAHQLAADGAR